jgi:hypothetical protein
MIEKYYGSILIITLIVGMLVSCCGQNNAEKVIQDSINVHRDGNDIELYKKNVNGTNCIISVYSGYGTSISCDWSK